ncbi:MAG: penicillin-binding protein 2 [Elusimicrobia bacterium]|nr:penicillin-binding protein 2 [Elusimicrobiota bacterium]
MDIRSRLACAAMLSLAPIVPLTARLVFLQVLQHQDLQTRASDEYDRIAHDAPARADIVDRKGRLLAQSMPSWSCFADRSAVRSAHFLARRLAPLLGLAADGILKDLEARRRFIMLKSGMTYDEAEKVSQARLPGVGITAGHRRVYPNDVLARNVIGTISTDARGLSGVELAYERELTQEPDKRRIMRDGDGHAIYRSGKATSSKPEPLKLTLDRNYQYFAEEALAEAVARHGLDGGIIAMQDPMTGEVLALASHPTDPLRNAAVQDSYEPGSTFKIITAAAAVGERVVGEEETFFCENGAWEVAPGVTIKDHEPASLLNLAGIIAHSSNIGTAKVAERVGAMRFYRYSQAFGFLNKTGIGLPGEAAGSLKPLSDMTRVSLITASYGYGVAVTPLQVLGAYSAIANGGILYEPSLVMKGREPVRVRRVASEETIAKLVGMLEGVVLRGTGQTAQIPGYRVAGKTGTARKLDPATKQYSSTSFVASFVGFAPVGRPRFTILVVLDNPKGGVYYGSQVAAPVFAKLARQVLTLEGVPPDPKAPEPASSAAPSLAKAF